MIDRLEQIGLTKREAEVYIALLQKKEFTAAELTKITTVTKTKIYEILQNLINKGACSESVSNGKKKYRGMEPQLALQNIITNYEAEVEQKKLVTLKQMSDAAKSLKKELSVLHNSRAQDIDSLDYIEVLTDVGRIRKRWLDIQNNTKKELLMFTKPPYTSSTIEDNVEAERKLIEKKKIIIKSIYEYSNLNSDEINDLKRIIGLYQSAGEQVKIVEELPMKLAISDETISMLALNDRISLKPSITTIIIDHPNFASAQKEVFNNYWVNAASLQEFIKI